MNLQNINSLDANSILSDDIFTEVFNEKDIILQARLILDLQERAKVLGVKQKFDKMLKAFEKAFKEIEAEKKRSIQTVDGITNFNFPDDSEYQNLNCGTWVADDSGVKCYFANTPDPIVACRHPILPLKRLKNLETGIEQIVIAFKRNHYWQEIKVPKEIISSANKIVNLSNLGIGVTTENSRYLVKFLSDIESFNEDEIEIVQSTTKLGWRGKDFIPYDKSIAFDGDAQFKSIYNAIDEYGSYSAWLDHCKKVRARGRIEPKMMLAASFSSVLVKPLGILPYIVDLCGETEGGKTVCLMLATSVFADPAESKYIKDFKTTEVSLEVQADVLNNLPMVLDDSSKTSSRVRDNFEGLVYDLCSGKGKTRSNKELGINRENTWQLCVLTTGEKPLTFYVNQGGAINRILEVECEEDIFEDPQETATIVKNNFGFAGKKFINTIKLIGIEEIQKIYNGFCQQLFDTDKMQKQAMSLAAVLTADKIATEYIFKDGNEISIEDAKKILIEKGSVSDNQRCYDYLVDMVDMHKGNFDYDNKFGEKWGSIDTINGIRCAIFYPQALDNICRQGGFNKESFIKWARKNGKLVTADGRSSKLKRTSEGIKRCFFIKLPSDEVDDSEFVEVENTEIPFLKQ